MRALCLSFFVLFVRLYSMSSLSQYAGYYSLRSNSTTLVLPTQARNPCISIPSKGILHCGVDGYNRFVLHDTDLRGLVDVTIILSSEPTDWYSAQYFTTADYDSIHVLSDSILVNYPQYGALLSGTLNISFKVNPSQYSSEYFQVIGIYNNTFATSLLAHDPLMAYGIEPASWFFKAMPAVEASSGMEETSWMLGLPTHGYIEFVLNNSDILKHRRFSTLQDEYNSVADTSIDLAGTVNAKQEKINICILTSPNMDGQKSIWLQQSEFMNKSRFHFTWFLSLTHGRSLDERLYPELLSRSSVYSHLKKLSHVKVVDNPYNGYAFNLDNLDVGPEDGSPTAGEVWNDDIDRLYKYIHDRLVAAKYQMNDITPSWCREFYELILKSLTAEQCEVVVYGNARGFSSDVFIADASRALGLPTVTELLNLYLDIDCLPDAVVAPSTYAVEHESISTLEEYIAAHRRLSPGVYDHVKVPLRNVIPPSVNAKVRFNPALTALAQSKFLHGCENVIVDSASSPGMRNDHFPCISIGFVARLSPEKSPGLFLQAAEKILQLYPFARFTFVGDGILSESLKQLAERLKIRWAVTFLGWVSDDLPQLLKTFDIVVNPSLRAWSETFCIANIEVMSMEVPLVTFGVGGIGEYVRGPTGSSSNATFTVTSNAVLVNTATPEAIADAVHYLILNPLERTRLGKEGRRSVKKFFTVERQMEQYSRLYTQLHTSFKK